MIKSALKALYALAIAASLSACISAPVPLTPKLPNSCSNSHQCGSC
ncbi:hypothetical protein HXV84_24000 [Pseudomonas amygdali pv. morsprunorum]|nr:hypothetical protein [Pseudomonas amygdali pv. morsprunorum]